jgi:predicted transcriptional regulator
MINTTINLNESTEKALREISEYTGKSPEELITSAIEKLITQHQQKHRLEMMRKVKGIGRDRDDIPSF